MIAALWAAFLLPKEFCMTPRRKVIERVCALVRQGSSLREIAGRSRMPSLATLTRWLAEDSDFRQHYETALHVQRTVFADDVVAIADKGDDAKATDRKLRVDARKWRVRINADEQSISEGPPENLAELLQQALDYEQELRKQGKNPPFDPGDDDEEEATP